MAEERFGNVECQPQLHMSDDCTATQHTPNAVVQLALGCDDAPDEERKVTMQLTLAETYDLLQKLDQLQGQVDRMLAQ